MFLELHEKPGEDTEIIITPFNLHATGTETNPPDRITMEFETINPAYTKKAEALPRAWVKK